MVKTKLDLCPLKDGVVPELRGQQLPTGEKILKMEGLNPKEGNTVVTNYYQVSLRFMSTKLRCVGVFINLGQARQPKVPLPV